ISANPKPNGPHTSTPVASLSKPAARPTGFGNSTPNAEDRRTGSSTTRTFDTSVRKGSKRVAHRIARNARWWARSGDNRNMSRRSNRYTDNSLGSGHGPEGDQRT